MCRTTVIFLFSTSGAIARVVARAVPAVLRCAVARDRQQRCPLRNRPDPGRHVACAVLPPWGGSSMPVGCASRRCDHTVHTTEDSECLVWVRDQSAACFFSACCVCARVCVCGHA
jgi:hypothetical protein